MPWGRKTIPFRACSLRACEMGGRGFPGPTKVFLQNICSSCERFCRTSLCGFHRAVFACTAWLHPRSLSLCSLGGGVLILVIMTSYLQPLSCMITAKDLALLPLSLNLVLPWRWGLDLYLMIVTSSLEPLSCMIKTHSPLSLNLVLPGGGVLISPCDRDLLPRAFVVHD